MTVQRLACRALVGLLLVLPVQAHGGSYAAPMPPMGNGPASAGPGAFAPTTGGPGAGGMTGGLPGGPMADLTHWSLWWLQNQARFLELKEHVRAGGPGTGGDGWFLGQGQKEQKVSLAPKEQQVRQRVVPALLEVLARESNNDLVTGALIALAKVGDGGDPAEASRLEEVITRFLSDSSQEVRETAAVALGILASPRSIPTLAHLLWNTDSGQKLARAEEVVYRTRAFAAYGLGLVGARTSSELDRQMIASILLRALAQDDTHSSDLAVACVISLGLVPLATLESPASSGKEKPSPASSRPALLDFLLEYLRDTDKAPLARAQCPVALARLLQGLPPELAASARARIADELLGRLEADKDKNEVLESCILALGAIGTNGAKDLDVRIRRALASVPKALADPQARAFAMIAAAEAGARFGADTPAGLDDARDFISDQLAWGKNLLQPWAGLAGGVFCRRLLDQGLNPPALELMRRHIRRALEDEGSPERLGAYALAAGLARAEEAVPALMRLLEKELQDDVRGQVAISLGLLGHVEARELLRAIVAKSRYHPELLRQCAIALGLLGDKEIGVRLAGMLGEARSLAAQAAIASALGFIGDQRSIDPLLELLSSRVATDGARAFAAVALGNVSDKELLPWNDKIGCGLNYRAAPATLMDPLGGKGILDIF